MQTFPRGWPAVAVVLLGLPSKIWSLRFLDVREANALVVCCAWGSKVTVIEVDGKALMLAGKLSLSRRAINGGTCGHPCVASSTILLMNGWISASLLPMFFAAWIKLHDVFALLAPVELP